MPPWKRSIDTWSEKKVLCTSIISSTKDCGFEKSLFIKHILIDNVLFTALYEKMAMLLKMTVLFLLCLTLICYGKDQSFDQSLEQIGKLST